MQTQPTIAIEYIGKKEYKTDNVNHTRIVWNAPGEVQQYPETLAPALLAYKDIWRVANGQAAPKEPEPKEDVPERSARQASASKDVERGPSMRDDAKAGPEPARKPGSRFIE